MATLQISKRTFIAPIIFAGLAFTLLPIDTPYAQDICTHLLCDGDTNAEIKAKDKGGWRGGHSPEELAEQSRLAEIARAKAESVLYPPIVQDYAPSPAIWKLADEDTTIYLFGTYHILPRDFRWRNQTLDQIVFDAEELIVETSDEDSSSGDGAIVEAMIKNILDNERKTISERLTEPNRFKWKKAVEMSGASLAAVDRMPIFLTMMGMGLGFSEQLGSKREFGVETVLEAEFKQAGKPIDSIEDGNEIMANLISIDENLLIADLEEGLTKWDGETMEGFFASLEPETEDELAGGLFKGEHDWARGQLEELDDTMFGESAGSKQVYRILLTDRNIAWAEWLDDRLDQPGTILVAVGAAHFEGPDSVQVMLEKRDLSVDRIQ